MYLSEYNQHARRAHHARKRIRFLGATPQGHRLWTEEEDMICKKYGSDYSVLMKKLPNRSYQALRSRCQKLDLRPKRQILTARDLAKLRRFGPTATPETLKSEFPTRTLAQLKYLRRYYNIARLREPFKATGYPVLDQIRQRCFELNYTMVDLDALAKTKQYFQKANWQGNGLSTHAVCKAAKALDGEIHIRWRDE